MKNIYILFLFVILFSCSTKNRNEIHLFNGLRLKLNSQEHIVKIQPSVKDKYTSYFNSQTIQIPLFKHIIHSNYDIFVGIPFNTTIQELSKEKSKITCDTVYVFNSDSNSYYQKYIKNNLYITEYAKEYKDKGLLYISSVTKSKKISDSLFNQLDICKRITIIE